MGWGVSVTPLPLFTPGKDPVPIVQEDGWAPGPVWTGAENLAPTGIRSLDRPARSQSLYRLRPQNSSDTIGNRTRNLPTCCAVPQPTAPLRAPSAVCTLHFIPTIHVKWKHLIFNLITAPRTEYSGVCTYERNWSSNFVRYSICSF